jgi:hypothetical protein
MKVHTIIPILSATLVLLIYIPLIAYADNPVNIRITNIRGTQFTVSWKTRQPEKGQIIFGENPEKTDSWQILYDDRGETIVDDIHYVTLRHLIPDTVYYFDIVSGDTHDNQQGKHHIQKTSGILNIPDGSCHAVGQVFIDNERQRPAYDSIIYMTIHNNDPNQQTSSTESCILSKNNGGYWAIEMANAVNLTHDSRYLFSCNNSRALIEVESGNNGSAQILSPLIDDTNGYMPTISIDNKLREILFTMDFLSDKHHDFQINYSRYDKNEDSRINLSDILMMLENLAGQQE